MSTGKRDLRVYWSQTSKAMNNLTPSDESKPNRTKSETATLFRSIRLGHAKFTLSVRADSACHFCDYYSTLVFIEFIFFIVKSFVFVDFFQELNSMAKFYQRKYVSGIYNLISLRLKKCMMITIV